MDQTESEAALRAELVDEAKRLATRYYRATGKPLGVTGFDGPWPVQVDRAACVAAAPIGAAAREA